MKHAWCIALALVVFAGCASTQNAPEPVNQPAKLGGGVVAVAGSVAIDDTLVAAVASHNGESAHAAADALLFDAVFAQGATAHKLDQTAEVRIAERSARARLVVSRIAHDAEARGPATDDEVKKLSARHWREVDLPEQARVVHAVVINPKDPSKKPRMRAVAEALRAAVLDATDGPDFLARAKRVDAQGLDLKPEALPLFCADGRVVEGDGTLDTTFAAAAFALKPGETSAIVETQFGLHVIRLLERLPAKEVPFEERRARFTDEAVARRGHEAYIALLADLKRRHPVIVDPAADALMSSASVQRP